MPEVSEDLFMPFDIDGGYWPSTSYFPPQELWNTIKAGQNVWLRDGNFLQGANGSTQLSSTNLGARIFPLNDSRAEIAGALVSGRLPFASILRLPGGVFLYLSELTSQQVYVNETSVSGLTTATSAGILRVAIPNGSGGYNVYDAGFDPPVLPTGNVTTPVGGAKGMVGGLGVALCAWRTTTNAISAPSDMVATTLAANDTVSIQLLSAVTGQDGWIFAGTDPGDDTTPLKVVRYVRITPRGTFTATNGSVNITAGVGTSFLVDIRPGDVVTIDAASYTIATVPSQTTATLTANFTGTTGSGKTMTITTANAEWFATELGNLIQRDIFKPSKAAGLFMFMNRVLLWGAGAESSSAVTGPAIFVMLENNPEHIGLFNITTTFGDDLLNLAASGDNRSNNLFMLTRNTLEIVTLADDGSYRVRVKHQPGFKNPKTGVVYKDVFYGFAQRPLRTTIESETDVEFGTPVFADMDQWNSDRVVMGVDAKNEAVLYGHYDGSSTTKIIPYRTELQKWNPPITVSGQVTDIATVNGTTYLIVLTGGNYRAYTWEGGTGASGAFIGSQYIHEPNRWKVKGLLFQGYANMIYIFLATPGSISDVSSTAGAAASFALSTSGNALQPEIFTNLAPARAAAIRCDFPPTSSTAVAGVFNKLQLRAYPLETRR